MKIFLFPQIAVELMDDGVSRGSSLVRMGTRKRDLIVIVFLVFFVVVTSVVNVIGCRILVQKP